MFYCVKTNDSYIEILVFHSYAWNHFTVCKYINTLKYIVLNNNILNHLIV